MDTNTLNRLIDRAKILSHGRAKNKGRPYTGMPAEQAQVVSTMRKKGCSVMSIYRVLSEEKMTDYKTYQTFKVAYDSHKLNS